jgi:aryl-alcohol dehydrogenase-like predicted oxidoreductase
MSQREKRPLGTTGLDVTLVGFGALEIGDARRRPVNRALLKC